MRLANCQGCKVGDYGGRCSRRASDVYKLLRNGDRKMFSTCRGSSAAELVVALSAFLMYNLWVFLSRRHSLEQSFSFCATSSPCL